jgi:hypothetical protein
MTPLIASRTIQKALICSVLFFSLFRSPLYSQVTQPLRYETEHKSGAYNYTVLSMGTAGLALFHQIDKYEGSKNFWEIVLLDSTLQATWQSEIELGNQFNLIGYDYIDEAAYFLYRLGSNDMGALHLIQIKTREHVIEKFDIETKLDFKLSYFNVIGNSDLLGGYVSRQPAVFLRELTSGRSKVIPGFFMKNTELLDIRTNQNRTFNTVIMDKSTEKSQLVIKTFDETGAVIVDDVIEVDADKTLLTGITSSLLREDLLVTGTWGIRSGKVALGIYTVLVDPFEKQSIQYYDFSQFTHFFDYYSARKAARIKAKAGRRKKSGKLPKYGVYVNAARLVEDPEGFILLSEVYSPMSTGNSNNGVYNPAMYGYSPSPYNYGYNPYSFTSYNPRYSPYGYSNSYHRTDVTMRFASVAVFNPQGKLTEDTGMKINDIKLATLDQVSDFTANEQRIIQIYRKEKELSISTTGRSDSVFTTKTTTPLALKNHNDAIKNEQEEEGSLRHWFGDFFFVWGYETVKEKDAGTRNIFYVNKLKAD